MFLPSKSSPTIPKHLMLTFFFFFLAASERGNSLAVTQYKLNQQSSWSSSFSFNTKLKRISHISKRKSGCMIWPLHSHLPLL